MMSDTGSIILNFLAAALGSWCYGYLFRAPVRLLLPGAFCGGIAFLCVMFSGNYIFGGTALAALLVGIQANIMARWLKVPVTPLIIPGIIPLVPGISAYNAFMAAVSGDYLAGLTGLVNVGAYTAAIAVGLNAAELLYQAVHSKSRNSAAL